MLVQSRYPVAALLPAGSSLKAVFKEKLREDFPPLSGR